MRNVKQIHEPFGVLFSYDYDGFLTNISCPTFKIVLLCPLVGHYMLIAGVVKLQARPIIFNKLSVTYQRTV